jgi:hypothetical protein
MGTATGKAKLPEQPLEVKRDTALRRGYKKDLNLEHKQKVMGVKTSLESLYTDASVDRLVVYEELLEVQKRINGMVDVLKVHLRREFGDRV